MKPISLTLVFIASALIFSQCEIANSDEDPYVHKLGQYHEYANMELTTTSTQVITTTVPSTTTTSTIITTTTTSTTTSTTTEEDPNSDPGPPDTPTSVSFSSLQEGYGALITWVNPKNPDFAGVQVRFSTVSAPADPTEGELITDLAATSNPNNRVTKSGYSGCL